MYLEDEMDDFHELYQDYQNITTNTIFQPCFNNLEQDTKTSFKDMKKEICDEVKRILSASVEVEVK